MNNFFKCVQRKCTFSRFFAFLTNFTTIYHNPGQYFVAKKHRVQVLITLYKTKDILVKFLS